MPAPLPALPGAPALGQRRIDTWHACPCAGAGRHAPGRAGRSLVCASHASPCASHVSPLADPDALRVTTRHGYHSKALAKCCTARRRARPNSHVCIYRPPRKGAASPRCIFTTRSRPAILRAPADSSAHELSGKPKITSIGQGTSKLCPGQGKTCYAMQQLTKSTPVNATRCAVMLSSRRVCRCLWRVFAMSGRGEKWDRSHLP